MNKKGGCVLFFVLPLLIIIAITTAAADSVYKAVAIFVIFGGLYLKLIYHIAE